MRLESVLSGTLNLSLHAARQMKDDNNARLRWFSALGTCFGACMAMIAAIASCAAAFLSYSSITDERGRYAEQHKIDSTPIVRIANEHTHITIDSSETATNVSWFFKPAGDEGICLHNYGKGNAHQCTLYLSLIHI